MHSDRQDFEIAACIVLASALVFAGAARGAKRGSDCDIARLDDSLWTLAQPWLRE